MAKHRGNPGLRGRLLEKSIEAYILALETINRLSIRYRVETFAYLICNAWELLLKARILSETGNKWSIYYPPKQNEKRKTLALRDCLKRVILDENDAVRRNLETVADLRDDACHFVIAAIPKEVIALFQACVLNYHAKLNEWFDESLSQRTPVGMMTLVYDVSPDGVDLSNAKLRRQMGVETADYLMRYGASVLQSFEDLGRPAEFSINIDYRFQLTKKAANADVSLTSGPDGAPASIVEVPKDPSKTHPYLQSRIKDQLNQRFGPGSVNAHELQCYRAWKRIDENSAFVWRNALQGSPQYSQSYLDRLITEFAHDPCIFEKAKDYCKRTRSPRR